MNVTFLEQSAALVGLRIVGGKRVGAALMLSPEYI